ncbi:hypothetical protein SD70_24660 [Gordoniibacillus kamchatkensis]|uniref:Uncharacterized protein n=1 Tax=Gordoniibacillus kamchatkensis TaxID=1590651 RepID=A0ABR5ACF6_9BACL|nr:hypothetical protein [Paenibacillus sp. VKM B-2647]KIL38724.1 hypothetical protein SD70_24660 [Paenibacillus sp. VKM B-2647]
MVKILYKSYSILIILLFIIVMYSILFFNINNEDIKWQLKDATIVAESQFDTFQEWKKSNIKNENEELISTNNDPFIISPSIKNYKTKKALIELDVKTDSSTVQIFYKKANEPQFTEEKSKVLKTNSLKAIIDGDFDQIRIDPTEKKGSHFKIIHVDIKWFN